MGELLLIDSDDVDGLSEALREALKRKGANFGYYDFDKDNDEDDIDPYLGTMPKATKINRDCGINILYHY